MVSKKPRVVIIGAGMAGLTAANKLHTAAANKMELAVVEGGTRIGGRISTSEFSGDRIEQGATWIHGIEGSPVYKIAAQTNLLVSDQPWECMDGTLEDPVTAAEGGHVLAPAFVDPISRLFKNLMDFIQCKLDAQAAGHCAGELSVGSFLRRGLAAYLELEKEKKAAAAVGSWSKRSLQQAVFAMHESTQRTYTSADDLCTLDYNAEKDYVLFPGEEITIAGGYSGVIDHLASVLPTGVIQLGRKVERIEWAPAGGDDGGRPVTLHFSDGTTMSADHVIVTVSLGVLKVGTSEGSSLFDPPLPNCKTGAISRLGFGVVNKVFLRLNPDYRQDEGFPFLQMVFHPSDSDLRNPKIPQWIRRTAFLCPIYSNSRVVLSWFTGQEALELEKLTDDEIIGGFSRTVSNLLPSQNHSEISQKFDKLLRTQWGSNPLFWGSYSYVAVGSSLDDMDTLAEPLPKYSGVDSAPPPLQILFAGEATHKTHYSTTHGAYFSGLREANRLLKHYNCIINY
ncbi:LOW QUALITY PROTEIN: probable polyamine oxidase 5 [Salvia miltiorrhiza]|uniref:LOW QUALITY PROTEIN: probable polyamine oxidase 5 n=1 Tax=Salvia miltiorrhiza TaxID=226208 RepID=UPI0025AC51A2|nr:LOW QUALITY PROTEIN: probable polyamine oxidase 5 [Salvia miltiorrhiza]